MTGAHWLKSLVPISCKNTDLKKKKRNKACCSALSVSFHMIYYSVWFLGTFFKVNFETMVKCLANLMKNEISCSSYHVCHVKIITADTRLLANRADYILHPFREKMKSHLNRVGFLYVWILNVLIDVRWHTDEARASDRSEIYPPCFQTLPTALRCKLSEKNLLTSKLKKNQRK